MNKVALSLLVSAFVASSMTLWLLEPPLKYTLYFFEVALILTLYHSRSGNFKKTRFKTKGKAITKLDYTISTVSLVLLAFTRLGSNNTSLNMIHRLIMKRRIK